MFGELVFGMLCSEEKPMFWLCSGNSVFEAVFGSLLFGGIGLVFGCVRLVFRGVPLCSACVRLVFGCGTHKRGCHRLEGAAV